MKKAKFVLSNILFYLVVAFSSFLIENLPFIGNPSSTGGLSMTAFSLTSFIALALIITLFVVEHSKNKLKVDWLLASLMVVVFIWLTTSIWTNQTTYTFTNEELSYTSSVTISKIDRIKYTLELAISMVVIYIAIFPFGRKIIKTKALVWLPILVIFGVLVLAGLSIYLDFDTYKIILTGGEFVTGAKSVFNNENVFGLWYLIGILATFVVAHYCPRWWVYLFMYLFYVGMIFTSCSTTLIIGGILISLFTVFEIFAGFKYKWKKHLVLLIVFLVVVGALIATYFIGTKQEWSFLITIREYLKKEVFSKDSKTFTGRTEIWNSAFGVLQLNVFKALFGYGYRSELQIFLTYHSSVKGAPTVLRTCHSGYVTMLLRGGILGLFLYLASFVYFLVCIVRLYGQKRIRLATTFLLCFLGLIAHSFVESTCFFECTISSLVMTTIFFLPPLFEVKRLEDTKMVKEIKSLDFAKDPFDYNALARIISSIIFGMILVGSMAFITPYIYQHDLIRKVLLYVLIGLALSWVFVPYLIALFYKNSSTHRFVIRSGLMTLLISGSLVGLYILLKFVASLSNSVIIPILFASYLVELCLITLIYSCVRKGNFKSFILSSIKGTFVDNGFGLLAGLVSSALIVVVLCSICYLDKLNYILIFAIAYLSYLLFMIIIPSKGKKTNFESIEQHALYKLKLSLKEGNSKNGQKE